MEVKPVKHIEKPKYPLKTELKEEELKKQIPKRWLQSPAAKVALGTLAAMTLAGCAPEVTDGLIISVTPPTEASVSVTPTPYLPEGTAAPTMMNIAPLFIHGEGRGSFGCVMVSPPAFLSEDEALVVINDAAKEYGLKFTAGDGPVFDNVLQPVTDMYGSGEKTPDTLIKFTPDFTDTEYGISIEYISTNDVRDWNYGEPIVTAGGYDTKDAAAQLSEALEQATQQDYSRHNVGVLYDPCARVEPDSNSDDQQEREEAKEKAQEMAQEQLRAQAKDFFEWLKNQGII